MKKTLLILLTFFPVLLYAQTMNNAIGMRGGITAGFEYRFYTDDANSYKFLLGTRDAGVQLHAMKEFHQYDLFEFSERLVLFYGAGLHLGFVQWNERISDESGIWYRDRSALAAGIDGLVGVEYLFYEVPLSLGLEAKPFVDVFGRDFFDLQLFDIAFTLKYRF